MFELSPYIIAIIVAWVAAQGSKFLIYAARNRSVSHFRQLYLSGGMPSSHSAMTAAFATVVGILDGFGSAIFGLAVLFAALVMYDAVMVRRSSGEQGDAIKALIVERKSKVRLPRAAKGHEPVEVLVGLLIGIVVGIVITTVL